MDALARLHSEILACRRCELEGLLPHPRPVAYGHMGARVMVIGQAPGVCTMIAGRPFSGPGGKLLRGWIARAGIPLEEQDRRVYFTSLTRCYPGKAPKGKGDRKPSAREVELCSPFLQREIELIDPVLVLLVGSMAIERFLGRMPLAEAVGQLFSRDGRWWLPLPHPSGVSRWLNHPEHRALVEEALERMRELLSSLGL